MTDTLSAPATPTACLDCVVANIKRHTADEQSWSDAGRPWRAWRRGYESVYGEKLAFPGRKELLSREDVSAWDGLVKPRMKPGTLAVYRSVLGVALKGLVCPHGHWGEGPEETGVPAYLNPSPRAGGPGYALPLPEAREFEYSPDEIFGDWPTQKWLPEKTGDDHTGFKLSVAQKCLSLALKHSWLQGAIGVPPVCPVDRTVLNAASRTTGEPWFVNWTEVNDVMTYRMHLDLLRAAAAPRQLAVWELLVFEGQLAEQSSKWQVPIDEGESERTQRAAAMFRQRFGTPLGDPKWPEAMLRDAVKSSLQHNLTYRAATPTIVKADVRRAMRGCIVEFLRRWSSFPPDGQNVAAFTGEMVRFQGQMNADFQRWFR